MCTMNGAEIYVGNYKTKDSVTDSKRYTKHHFK